MSRANHLASRLRRAPIQLLATVALLWTALEAPPAFAAEPTPEEKQKAASEFDAGVEYFRAAEYEAAARAFLRADVLLPNSEAIANAITAAERANDHLLVVEAAERGLDRKETDPGLAAEARRALSNASKHLARLDLGCEPQPCDLFIDGTPTDPGARYVLPGTHKLTATTGAGDRREQSEQLVAGTTYRVVLHPAAAGEEAADVSSAPHRAQAAPAAEREPDHGVPQETSRGTSPAWFYATGGVTLAVVGVWAWSGLDTLSALHKLPDPVPPEQRGERASVHDKALRTDLLLAGSVVMASITTYLGVAVVDWSGGESRTAIVPMKGGAGVVTTGRF